MYQKACYYPSFGTFTAGRNPRGACPSDCGYAGRARDCLAVGVYLGGPAATWATAAFTNGLHAALLAGLHAALLAGLHAALLAGAGAALLAAFAVALLLRREAAERGE